MAHCILLLCCILLQWWGLVLEMGKTGSLVGLTAQPPSLPAVIMEVQSWDHVLLTCVLCKKYIWVTGSAPHSTTVHAIMQFAHSQHHAHAEDSPLSKVSCVAQSPMQHFIISHPSSSWALWKVLRLQSQPLCQFHRPCVRPAFNLSLDHHFTNPMRTVYRSPLYYMKTLKMPPGLAGPLFCIYISAKLL